MFLRRLSRFSSPLTFHITSPSAFTTTTRMSSTYTPLSQRIKDKSIFKTAALINGEWITKPSSSSPQDFFQVEDPGTTQPLLASSDTPNGVGLPDLGKDDTRLAIEAANQAFKSGVWHQAFTADQRGKKLREVADLMKGQFKEDLATIMTAENGKSLKDARGEVDYSASFFDWFAAEAPRAYGDVIPSPTKGLRQVVVKSPLGVCALICPWNFPSAMFARKVAPALAAGNTVVLKAPAETPFSALALGELCNRVGIPKGVVNIVTTDKHTPEVGKELCENGDVKKVSFTGSTNVGKILMNQCSSTLKKLSMELGGNAVFIVFEDADIDEAVAGAILCKFRSSGQTCICANRVFVQSSVYAEFASKFASAVDKLKVGNGFDSETTHGPLIHSRALEKVARHVKSAVDAGGEILVGGKRKEGLDGYFWEPTVISEVKNACDIDGEETFGPVAALHKFETEDEVLKQANDTTVGLAGYFYSRDIGRIWRVAEALEVGLVGANTGMISNATIPFGGVKESGFGREGSKYGLDEFQVTKLIAMGGLGNI